MTPTVRKWMRGCWTHLHQHINSTILEEGGGPEPPPQAKSIGTPPLPLVTKTLGTLLHTADMREGTEAVEGTEVVTGVREP